MAMAAALALPDSVSPCDRSNGTRFELVDELFDGGTTETGGVEIRALSPRPRADRTVFFCSISVSSKVIKLVNFKTDDYPLLALGRGRRLAPTLASSSLAIDL
jgi:hypothetical protein